MSLFRSSDRGGAISAQETRNAKTGARIKATRDMTVIVVFGLRPAVSFVDQDNPLNASQSMKY